MNADFGRGALVSLVWLAGSAVAAVVIGYAMATVGWMAAPLLAVMVAAGIFFVESAVVVGAAAGVVRDRGDALFRIQNLHA